MEHASVQTYSFSKNLNLFCNFQIRTIFLGVTFLTIFRFTWYHVIFQTGPRDGVGVHVLQYNNKNALSNFGQ